MHVYLLSEEDALWRHHCMPRLPKTGGLQELQECCVLECGM
jgi:hypothetical protein